MDRKFLAKSILKSWSIVDNSINNTSDLLKWILDLNKNTHINITESSMQENSFWFYDKDAGCIRNKNKSFFSVTGLQYFVDNQMICQQPIIIQDEIGFLGIIAKEFNGVLHFLMQAKIEPGNLNGIQISPTIQATRSNFTCAHGGRVPLYLEYFKNLHTDIDVIYDQIQSEQGTRFIGKRNRNIIVLAKDEVEVHQNFRWMTLGQIKELMKEDNLVNMDTRTVLSGLLTVLNNINGQELDECFKDKTFYNSIFAENDYYRAISKLNDYKMYHDVEKKFVPLHELSNWTLNNQGVFCKDKADFEVKYYDVEIEGREVKKWEQPLFKAKNEALFVLFTRVNNGVREFLISLGTEIGCFDKVEFAPSLQIANYKEYHNEEDTTYSLFNKYLAEKKGIISDVMLSEEGGRFYHEENRNLIVELDINDSQNFGDNYLWVTYSTLNKLVESNNVLNIQLRNLMSLLPLEVKSL